MPSTNIITATIDQIRHLDSSRESNTYYSTDAGKEGIWNWGLPDPGVSDNLGTILKDADGNVWRRKIYNGEYMPEWFGALGDSCTDDTITINKTIKEAKNQTVIFTEGKTYCVSEINIANPVRLAGRGTLKKIEANNEAVINIEKTDNVTIENITIDGNRTIFESQSGSLYFGIWIKYNVQDSYQVSNVCIHNVFIKNTRNDAIFSQSATKITISNCHVENCSLECQRYNGSAKNYTAISVESASANVADIEISGCYIDQSSASSGGIRINASGNRMKNVKIVNNICLLAEMKNALLPGTGEVFIMAIECLSQAKSFFNNLLISGNLITCAATPVPTRFCTFGISLGGSADSIDHGLIGVVISNNILYYCRRFGMEIIGKHVTVIGNELYNCGYISITSNRLNGGMTGIKVIGNTFKGSVGSDTGYKQYFGGIVIQAIERDIYDTLIEGNIFDGTIGTHITTVSLINIRTGSPGTLNTGKLFNLNIVNNQFLSIVRHGISFDIYTETIVVGTVETVVTTYVHAENVNISGNMFKYSSSAYSQNDCYCIWSYAKLLKNLTIVNNTFDCLVSGSTRKNAIRLNYYLLGFVSDYINIIITNNIFKNTGRVLYISGLANGLMIRQNIIEISTTAIEITTASANVVLEENIIKNGTVVVSNLVTYLNPVELANATTTGLPLVTLNSTYQQYATGTIVVCRNIHLIYEKTSDNTWVEYTTANVLA
jgi:hypothetical protein